MERQSRGKRQDVRDTDKPHTDARDASRPEKEAAPEGAASDSTPARSPAGRRSPADARNASDHSAPTDVPAGRAAGTEPAHRARAKASRVRATDQTKVARHDPKLGQFLRLLGEQIGKHRIELYFSGPGAVSIADGTIVVAAESSFVADLISRRFANVMRSTADVVFDSPHEIRIRVAEAQARPGGGPKPVAETAAPEQRAHRRKSGTASDERHDLARFIVGAPNRMAFDSAERVISSQSASDPFRRLFVHGSCGNGKTHLLRGIARRLRQADPSAKIRCVAAEAFTNEYIQAIQSRTSDAFRKKHRGLDLLCLDDVHFLARKEATQIELVHTLDAIELDGSRLVLASDEHPHRIKDLNTALSSRFVSGMVVEVTNPDEQLASALVGRFAVDRGISLDPAALGVLVEIALESKSSVRDLEGMLTRLVAGLHAEKLQDGVVSADLARSIIQRRSAAQAAARPVRFDEICDRVCSTLCVSASDLGKSGRHPRVVMARGIITVLCKEMTTMSYPEIARAIGKRNHSTVITSHQRMTKQMEQAVNLGCALDGMTTRQACDHIERAIRASR